MGSVSCGLLGEAGCSSSGPLAPLIGRLSREGQGWAKWGVICGLRIANVTELGRHGAGVSGCTALDGRRFDSTFAAVNQRGWVGGW